MLPPGEPTPLPAATAPFAAIVPAVVAPVAERSTLPPADDGTPAAPETSMLPVTREPPALATNEPDGPAGAPAAPAPGRTVTLPRVMSVPLIETAPEGPPNGYDATPARPEARMAPATVTSPVESMDTAPPRAFDEPYAPGGEIGLTPLVSGSTSMPPPTSTAPPAIATDAPAALMASVTTEPAERISTLPDDAMFGDVAMPTVVMAPPTTTLEP